MATELEELVDFLSAPRLEVRKSSVAIVLGLTGSEEGIAMLASRKEKLVPALLHLLAGPEKVRSWRPARDQLLPLSTPSSLRKSMGEDAFTSYCAKLGSAGSHQQFATPAQPPLTPSSLSYQKLGLSMVRLRSARTGLRITFRPSAGGSWESDGLFNFWAAHFVPLGFKRQFKACTRKGSLPV